MHRPQLITATRRRGARQALAGVHGDGKAIESIMHASKLPLEIRERATQTPAFDIARVGRPHEQPQ